MIFIKRIYDEPSPHDGFRVLVDRLWPRGISKEKADLDLWAKEIAPSTELRIWFNHDPEKFKDFEHQYIKELKSNNQAFNNFVKELSNHKTITLLYAAHDQKINQAFVLQKYLTKFVK